MFEFDHERCDPRKWTPSDVLLFSDFLRNGYLSAAAALARLGVKLVQSDGLKPPSGTMELIGYCKADEVGETPQDENDLRYDVDDDITELVPVYRAPSVYAVRLYECDGDEGSSPMLEIKPTLDEAEKLAAMYREPA